MARQGFSGRKTSPKRTLRTGIPIQKMTYTSVGVRFAVSVWVPAKPAYTARTNAEIPKAPRTISAGSCGTASSRRPASAPPSKRGLGHSVASATNDTTSTTQAAQAKSQRGMGRSWRPTRPCADATPGASSPDSSAPTNTAQGTAVARRIRA